MTKSSICCQKAEQFKGVKIAQVVVSIMFANGILFTQPILAAPRNTQPASTSPTLQVISQSKPQASIRLVSTWSQPEQEELAGGPINWTCFVGCMALNRNLQFCRLLCCV